MSLQNTNYIQESTIEDSQSFLTPLEVRPYDLNYDLSSLITSNQIETSETVTEQELIGKSPAHIVSVDCTCCICNKVTEQELIGKSPASIISTKSDLLTKPQNNTVLNDWNLDIDGNGKVEALSDGIMAVRYMFGAAFTGNALIDEAISPNATRNLTEIQSHLQEGVDNLYLDIDGNGKVEALSDGIMAVRYMFGSAFPDDALIDGAISPNATRNLQEIESHLGALTNLDANSGSPTVSLEVIDGDLGEENNPGQLSFNRTGPTDEPLTVFYTLGGDAIERFDYSLEADVNNLSASVNFGIGESTKTFDIEVFDDSIIEFEESIEISIQADSNYHLGNNSLVSLSIIDNEVSTPDEAPPISFEIQEAPRLGSGDYQIDALLFQDDLWQWNTDTVTYSFLDSSAVSSYILPNSNPDQVSEISNALKSTIREVIHNEIAPFVNLNFIEVSDSVNSYGKIRFSLLEKTDAYAYAYPPSDGFYAATRPYLGDVYFSKEYEHGNDTNGFLSGPGSHGYATIIHEILHALGVKHPGDYNGNGSGESPFLPEVEDNLSNSLMTYNFSVGKPVTLMPYDIKALQYLYGVKPLNNSDTNYEFERVDKYIVDGNAGHNSNLDVKQTIWDSNGIDTVDFSRLSVDDNGYRFDMSYIFTSNSGYNTASYQHRASKNFYNTHSEGTLIAEGVIIENLINSSSSDTIFANTAANVFSGYSLGLNTGDDIYWNTNSADTLDLSSYTTAQVTRTKSGNDEIISLGSNGSITIKDYYVGPGMEIILQEPQEPESTINLAVSPSTVTEDGDDSLLYTFTRIGSTNSSLTVNFALGGTATLGTDYTVSGATSVNASSGSISFAANETSKTITIDPTSDGRKEGDETIALTLTNSSNYNRQVTTPVTAIIVDDDLAVPRLSINDVTVTEGDNASAVFTVTMTGTTTNTVTVNYATVDDSAKAGTDYTNTSGTLTFSSTEKTQTIIVPLVGDANIEGSETFFVNLTEPTNALISDGQGQGTIIDDDSFAGDVGAPRLNGVQILPDTVVDSDSDSAEVEFIVSATDDFSGIDKIFIRFESPSGDQKVYQSVYTASFGRVDLISGTKLDGTYAGVLELPQFAETGTWTLSTVLLEDETGNQDILNATELSDLGFFAEFEVLNSKIV